MALDPVAVGGDFVVGRSDGGPSYQLAVVVDDAAMGVTQVIRGDDLVPSTPRQILLYRALGLDASPRSATSRSSSGPTAAAWPSGTSRSSSATLRDDGVDPGG